MIYKSMKVVLFYFYNEKYEKLLILRGSIKVLYWLPGGKNKQKLMGFLHFSINWSLVLQTNERGFPNNTVHVMKIIYHYLKYFGTSVFRRT